MMKSIWKKNVKKAALFSGLVWSVLGIGASASYASEMNPFVLPWDDTSPTVVSAAAFNSPIGTERVRVSPSGHLVLSQGETGLESDPRIRFIGMNMTFGAGLPPHEMAPKVAGRLAKFGINGVRFHHVDNLWSNALLDYESGDSRHVNTKRLDDLHYFISQLKTNGIYTDMNLLVSRTFKAADGFPKEIEEVDWKAQHVLGFFNDHALGLQKEYASNILCVKNPYTGLTMAEDPAVAFVEILNENGILQKWTDGDLDKLPAVFKKQLQSRWNEWLRERYSSEEELRKSWKTRNEPLGENQLKNPHFDANASKGGQLDIAPWQLEVHSGKAQATLDQGPTEKNPALRIDIVEPSEAVWHVQLIQPEHQQKQGQIKTFSFWAKADQALSMSVSVRQAHDPWQQVGLGRDVSLSKEWQHFSFTYLATGNETNVRPNLSGFGAQKCSVWLSEVSLVNGGILGDLPQSASLKEGTIPNVAWSGDQPVTQEARSEWIKFLVSLENRYYKLMCKYLRQDCEYQGLIFGTILANSPASVQAQMDVIDSHGYWHHPQFPGAQWDNRNWTVGTNSMTTKFENTFTSCALQRVANKPFFCTEYQHPSPNLYGAEGPLMMGAYAALQDWDGFWFFDYGTGNGTTDMGYFSNFFDTAPHPTKMANLLMASYLFRRGDVSPAREAVVLGMDSQKELETLLRAGAWNLATLQHLGLNQRYALQNRVAMSLGNPPQGVTHSTAPKQIQGDTMKSDTGELLWGLLREDDQLGGRLLVNTPRTKAWIGSTQGKVDTLPSTLGEVTLRPGETQLDWCTLAITLLEGESFAGPARALIIATGRTENTDMKWTNEKKNSVSNQWGKAPVLTEGVSFEILLPVTASKVQLYALDTQGNRMNELKVQAKGTQAELSANVSEQSKTIWYEVVIGK